MNHYFINIKTGLQVFIDTITNNISSIRGKIIRKKRPIRIDPDVSMPEKPPKKDMNTMYYFHTEPNKSALHPNEQKPLYCDES
jgi:hypothetical protein